MAISKLQSYRDKRMESLYKNDAELNTRNSYENPDIKKVYEEYLKEPLSEIAEEKLHTTYKAKEKTVV